MIHTRDPLNDERQPTFDVDGVECGLTAMLEANCDDAALCDWLRAAKVGDHFPAFVECRRAA